MILQPGIVAGAVPYLLVRNKLSRLLNLPFQEHQYLALLLFLAGMAIVFHCVFRFFKDGLGTLSPVIPTKQLVIGGLYQYSRNPMYIGVMLLLTGEVLFCTTVNLLIYAILVFIAFHLFVVFKEEPRLKRDFGEQYNNYKHQVRRWI